MAGGVEYTIDELARAAGTTVRSVRVYHERGVLPPPQVRGRTGYYGGDHLNRVRTISRLLDRGIKLNGIKELLAAWDRGDDLGAVLGVAEIDSQSPADAVDSVPATELQERFADVPDGLARVVTAGLYAPVDATTYRIADPELVGFVDRLAGVGVPNTDILRELERLGADCDRMARRFVDLLRQFAWEPFAASAHEPQDVAEFSERASLIRTLSGRIVADLVTRQVERHLDQDADVSEVLRDA
ncbi:MerR family transcriptional regulator [Nocardia sp. NPDC004722]